MNSISQLYQELQEKHPALNGRLERGVNLFNAGHVRKVSDNGGYVVTSANRRSKYSTFYHTCLDGNDVGWHCSCKDVENGAPRLDFWGSVNRPICKHIVAAAIDEMVSEDKSAAELYREHCDREAFKRRYVPAPWGDRSL